MIMDARDVVHKAVQSHLGRYTDAVTVGFNCCAFMYLIHDAGSEQQARES